MCVLVAQLCPTLCDPWTVACQAPLPWDSLGKHTGVGCHFQIQHSCLENPTDRIQKNVFFSKMYYNYTIHVFYVLQ